MPGKGWSTPFDDPIVLPDGRKLVTLKDAADYITKLPKAEHDREHWRLAVRLLLDAADHGGIVMMARIAVQRALNHGKQAPEPEPRKKRAKAYRIVK